MALHAQDTGHIVQLLGNVFTDTAQLAATGAGGGVGLVADLHAGQTRGQWCALRCQLSPGGVLSRAELFDLVIDRLQVRIQSFFQQAALLCVVTLRLGSKLQALEVGVLKGEFVDEGLFEGQGLGLLLQNTFICRNGMQQIGDHLAQLVCAQLGDLFGCDHHETQCATGLQKVLFVHVLIDFFAIFFEQFTPR